MPSNLLIQKIRSQRKRKHIPCLIYSKKMNSEDIFLAKELGLGNLLGMPFDRQQAKDMIVKMLQYESELDPIEKKIRLIEDLLDEEKPSEALKLVDHTITKKSPFRKRVKTLIGEIWIQISQMDKAKRVIEEVLQEDPKYIPAFQLLAKVYSLMKDHDKALSILKELIEISPKNLNHISHLGSAYIAADRYDDAKKVFSKIKKIDKDNEQANDGLGIIAVKEGNFQLAAELLSTTQNGTELSRIFNNLAIGLASQQKYDEAIDIYHQAIQLLSNKTKLYLLHYNLGLAYKRKGDLGKALLVLVKSYKEDSKFEKAYAAIVRITQTLRQEGKNIDPKLIKEIKDLRAVSIH